MKEKYLVNRLTAFVWAMFRLNLLFMASNAILIVALLLIPFHLITLPVYLIGLFLLVPSLVAVLSTIKRFEEAEKSTITKVYVQAYKEEFKGAGLFSVVYLVLIALFSSAYFGVLYLPEMPGQVYFVPAYAIIAIILFVHFVFGLLIRVKYIIDVRSTWKLGFYCISKYPLNAVTIFAGTVVMGVLVYFIPFLIPLGVIPMVCYFLTSLCKKMFKNITAELNIREDSDESKDDS